MGGERSHRPEGGKGQVDAQVDEPKHVGGSVQADRGWAQNRISNFLNAQKAFRKPSGDGTTGDEKAVSHPGEPAEKEADHVADHVTDQLHGGNKAEHAPAAKEEAPAIGAKLEGAGARILRTKDDKKAPEKEGLGYYRGGNSCVPKPGEYKVKNGMVQPTHGVSLYNNAKRVEKWGTFIIMSIPSTLKIIQRGADPEHFEIVPVAPMTEADYKAALSGVQLKAEEKKS